MKSFKHGDRRCCASWSGLQSATGASAPAPTRRLKSPLQAEACSTNVSVVMFSMSISLLAGFAYGEIVDRLAVVVDRAAIKQSDIAREIRITAFINAEKPDFSVAEQKKAVSRLIDQAILRKEIGTAGYPEPDSAQVDQLVRQIRQRYRTEAAFRQALADYRLTAEELMDHLRWQETVLQFIALRFGSTGAAGGGSDANQPFFNWLDETRKQTRVLFKEENLK
jgi:hypothetical protein